MRRVSGLMYGISMDSVPANMFSTEISTVPGVPFANFVLRLSSTSTPSSLFQTYSALFAESCRLQAEKKSKVENLPPSAEEAPHNVIMTRRWMCVIPRLRGGIPEIGANSLGMLGLVWVKDNAEREAWAREGPKDFITSLAYPAS